MRLGILSARAARFSRGTDLSHAGRAKLLKTIKASQEKWANCAHFAIGRRKESGPPKLPAS